MRLISSGSSCVDELSRYVLRLRTIAKKSAPPLEGALPLFRLILNQSEVKPEGNGLFHPGHRAGKDQTADLLIHV